MCRVVLAGETVARDNWCRNPGYTTRPSSAPPETPRTRGGFRTVGEVAQRGMSFLDFGLNLSPPWEGSLEALVFVLGALLFFPDSFLLHS